MMSDFKPDEQYDPNRPNDLSEYQYYRKKLKEERRVQLMEAKKRREQHGSSGESSYYTDSEEDVPRRDGMSTPLLSHCFGTNICSTKDMGTAKDVRCAP